MRPALATVLLLAFAAPAHGQGFYAFGTGGYDGTPRSVTSAPARVTGDVVVDFRSHAATCAAVGLCGISGTIVHETAPARGSLAVVRYERRTEVAVFTGDTGSLTARVERREPDGRAHVCTDARAGSLALATRVNGSRARLGLRRRGDFGGLEVDTRCTGPLSRDIAAYLPERMVPLATLRLGGTAVDLAGEGSFTAGGLTGTVRSTVRLALGRGRPERSDQQDTGPRGKRRRRMVTATYDVVGVSGGLRIEAEPAGDPFPCSLLDTCGLTTRLVATPELRGRGSAFVLAEAPARRPRRDLHAALGLTRRGNPRGIKVQGFATVPLAGAVSAGADRAGEASCRSAAPLEFALLELTARAGPLRARLTRLGPLRTRCPGPSVEDVSTSTGLATGRATGSGAALTLALTRGGRFASDGYRGTTSSDLELRLRRTDVSEELVADPF